MLSNEFIAGLKLKHVSIIELLQKKLSGLRINTFLHNGFWQDLGTPKRFFDAQQAILSDKDLYNSLYFQQASKVFNQNPYMDQKNFFASKEIYESLKNTEIQNSIINGVCHLGQILPNQISNCLIMPESTLEKPGYTNQIIGPNYTVSL